MKIIVRATIGCVWHYFEATMAAYLRKLVINKFTALNYFSTFRAFRLTFVSNKFH